MKPSDTAETAAACSCPDCPTYDSCMGTADERLYCVRGATGCEPVTRRCVCPECPVWNEYELGSTYFCTQGAAK